MAFGSKGEFENSSVFNYLNETFFNQIQENVRQAIKPATLTRMANLQTGTSSKQAYVFLPRYDSSDLTQEQAIRYKKGEKKPTTHWTRDTNSSLYAYAFNALGTAQTRSSTTSTAISFMFCI